MSIKSKFCAACGNQATKFVDNTCIDCYFKKISIVVPKEITILACPECDSVNVKGFWIKADEDHNFYLIQALIDKLKLPAGIELEDIEILQQGKEGVVQLSLNVNGKRFTVEKSIALYVEKRLCEVDAKRKRDAYEGILQVRTEKDVPKFLTKVNNLIGHLSHNFLKVEEMRQGADFYFIDANTMRQAATLLKKHMRLKLKESFAEYSWNKLKNRPKYKITISARA
jgi:NMD protein affecting ribosome stability and mRNA decay